MIGSLMIIRSHAGLQKEILYTIIMNAKKLVHKSPAYGGAFKDFIV